MFQPSYQLRAAFGANAAFSILCTIPMVMMNSKLASLTGIQSELLFWLGVGVGVNALFLAAYAGLPQFPKILAKLAVAGDVAWVVFSAVALVSAWVALTWWGVALTFDVALIVGILGGLQYYFLNRS